MILTPELSRMLLGCCDLVVDLSGRFLLVAALKLKNHVHDVGQIDSVLPSGMIIGESSPFDQVFRFSLDRSLGDQGLDLEELLFSQGLGLMSS